jgi:predicted double-glycine peptidase
MIPVITASIIALSITFPQAQVAQAAPLPPSQVLVATTSIPSVPFYSQFKDIASAKWQKVGCGIASLAMVIDYYSDEKVSVNTLLTQGIASGAYLNQAGWIHKGLISLSKKYGLGGSTYDFSGQSNKTALKKFEEKLKDGPVIASVHYKFDPKSTIPHLVVINGIDGDLVYYNDPAAKTGEKTISTADFLKAWKKRFIVIRPQNEAVRVALAQ